MSKKFLAPAVLGTAVALSGCGEKNNVVESCSYDQNILYADATNANKIRLHTQGLIHPIIVACSEEVRWEKKVDGSIMYGRSVSMTNPSTGKVYETSVPDAQAVQALVSELNLAPQIDEKVRPFYAKDQQAVINVLPGSTIQATASPEGQISWGDLSLVMETKQNTWNAEIAKKRAQDIAKSIVQALQKSWAQVNGLENIEYLSSQTYLTYDELGELYTTALVAYGNGDNQVMRLIADYNTNKLPTNADVAMMKRIIDAKRKGEVTLMFNASGTKLKVDISNWSYVVLLLLLWGVATVSARKIKNISQGNSSQNAAKISLK